MLNRILSSQVLHMLTRRRQRRRQWGTWMSVLAAIGVGATATQMMRSRNMRFLRMLQKGNAGN